MLDTCVINRQFAMVKRSYPDATYLSDENALTLPFRLDAVYEDIRIVRDCQLKILLDEYYPHSLPRVYETSGAIPDGFVHRYVDGSLCVGVPTQVLYEYPGGIELLDLIKGPITQCLYSAFFQEEYDRMPFGERAHGIRGKLQFYEDIFSTVKPEEVLALLGYAAAGVYRGSDKCPCGSGQQVWKCHGPILQRLCSEDMSLPVKNDANEVFEVLESYKARQRTLKMIRASLAMPAGRRI